MDIALLQVLTKDQIKALLRGIQNAFDEHVRWVCRCQNTLLTSGPVDEEILREDSHLSCRFGRWYYGELSDDLRASPDFRLLGEMHRRFHDAARAATRAKKDGAELTVEICENLVTAQSDLLLALNQYLKEVSEGDQLFDPLTGLLSRHKMTKLIGLEKSRAERNSHALSLAIADLDFFKSINDRFGHDAGDIVLREVAARLSSCLRVYDLLFRLGGEEFLFLFPDTDEEGAVKICERMREAIQKSDIDLGGGRKISVTVSFGVAPLPYDGDTGAAFRAADAALYRAKNGGRNRVEAAFAPGTASAASKRAPTAD